MAVDKNMTPTHHMGVHMSTDHTTGRCAGDVHDGVGVWQEIEKRLRQDQDDRVPHNEVADSIQYLRPRLGLPLPRIEH